ncbi:MAG: adenylate cyclase, class 2 [Thermoproteota archaeon]|nr:adenylate cyclase, class 2 [Thermoproteota archaeon]
MKKEIVELKARTKSLETIRKKMLDFKATYVGRFRQVDTYFNSAEGRLKIREVDGQEKTTLIYYRREDIAGPKRSEIIVINIQETELFKGLFEIILRRKVTVDKEREIYILEGTQIHLDNVQNLGTFIEFERKITDISKDREVLEELMKKLLIEEEDLIQGSYSDLLSS